MSNQSAFQTASFTQAGAELAGGVAGAFSSIAQGKIAQRFAELNAQAAELRAVDAIRRAVRLSIVFALYHF